MNFSRRIRPWHFTALVIVAALVIVGFMVKGWRDCTAQGGDYVRGFVWMTCIR